MSFRKTYVLSCDMDACHAAYHGIPPARLEGIAKRIEKAANRDHILKQAFKVGWGQLPVGRFGITVYFCPTCREGLQLEQDPDRFRREVESLDHTADHTVLLECQHEFSAIPINIEGFAQGLSVSEACAVVEFLAETTPVVWATCPACRRAWFESGVVDEMPNWNDILP